MMMVIVVFLLVFLMALAAYDSFGSPLRVCGVHDTSVSNPALDLRRAAGPAGSAVPAGLAGPAGPTDSPILAHALEYYNDGLEVTEGALLLHFLDLFGRKFDPLRVGLGDDDDYFIALLNIL